MYFSVFSDQQEKIIGMNTKPAFKSSFFHLKRWYVSVDGNATFCSVSGFGKVYEKAFFVLFCSKLTPIFFASSFFVWLLHWYLTILLSKGVRFFTIFNSNSSSSHEFCINICIYNYCTVVSINSAHKDKVNKIRCVSGISGLRSFDYSCPQALSLI